ncbi:tRNA-dihydrouridine(20) synthase [NAD(P)+]-like isoform X2 [Nematostella vectensis]|nr:tRNA-dihydrouridine(20) synthase [NAD(P)+]-like isoform X2 [Nematostella vectensis]
MYQNKYFLAPMVRIGTLPARLLALRYGADLVYTEEIIDFKMLRTTRVKNELLNTVDFVMSDGTVVFRTCQEETTHVVFQVGTADADRALQVAKMVEKDIAAFDVNMGCPKDYSVKGGMGAALLTEPEKVKKILTTLVKGLSIPVTCKIRILPTIAETVQLCKLIESTGVTALAVHGREKHERSRQPVHTEYIQAVAAAVAIPVIANGGSLDIKTFSDMEQFRLQAGCASIMVARAAQWNLSVFRREGPLSHLDVVKAYIKTAIECDNSFGNTKYCVLRLMHEQYTSEAAAEFTAAKDIREMCEVVGLVSFYKNTLLTRQAKQQALEKCGSQNPTSLIKRRLSDDSMDLVEMKFKFRRKDYPDTITPKSVLFEWTRDQKLQPPSYEMRTREEDCSFKSIVIVDNTKYASTEWEKSKRHAEQAAAAVCLAALGINDGRQRHKEM